MDSRGWCKGCFQVDLVFLQVPPCWLAASGDGRCAQFALMDHPAPRAFATSPLPLPQAHWTAYATVTCRLPALRGGAVSCLSYHPPALQVGGNGGFRLHLAWSRCPGVESWLGCARAVCACGGLRAIDQDLGPAKGNHSRSFGDSVCRLPGGYLFI